MSQVKQRRKFALSICALPALFAAHGDAPAASAPIAAYSFDEGAGSALADRSDNDHHGVLRNGPVWTSGKSGHALLFDGADDYVAIGDVHQADGRNGFTVSAWVKFAQHGGGERETHLVDKSACTGYANGGPWELGVGLTRAHKAEFLIYPKDGTPSPHLFSGAGVTSVDDAEWRFIAGRYDGAHLSIWVDGVQENSVAAPGLAMPDTRNHLEIGGRCNGYSYPFAGVIDDVRIYGRALTQAEIQADMATPVGESAPPPPPPDPAPDTTAPSVPSDLSASSVAATRVVLSWRASADNVGVAGYRVFRDGMQAGTTAATSFADDGVSANTAYDYTVSAHDIAGNSSIRSPALAVTTAAGAAVSYTTNFDLTENPISEGGVWRRADNRWTNVRTVGGVAFGTNGVTNQYDDSYALLSGFGPDQTAEAVVYRNPDLAPGATHEVELLLRFSDDAGAARGYECLFNHSGGYEIVRWNGPQGSFTSLRLVESGYLGRNLVTGDVLKATVAGNVISMYVNGVLMARAIDSTFTSGQPGIGFFIRPGGSPQLLGLARYTVTAPSGE